MFYGANLRQNGRTGIKRSGFFDSRAHLSCPSSDPHLCAAPPVGTLPRSVRHQAKDLSPSSEEVLRSEKDLFLVPKSFRSEELHCPAKDLFPFAEEVRRSEKDLFLVPKSFAAPPKIFFCSLKRFCGQKKIFFLFRRASLPRQRSFFVPRRGLEVRKRFFSWLKFYSLVKNRIFSPREGDC